MKVPLGSIILRTSEDFASSSQAAWIAASRDFTARDLGSPPCSAKTTCHIIQSSLPRCCAHRCPSYRDQGKLHPDGGARTVSSGCASTTVWPRCKPRQY